MKLYTVVPFAIQILVAKITVKIFYNFNIIGLENLRNISNGAIFASNHTSELDPIVVTTAVPIGSGLLPLFYVSKDKTYYQHMNWRRIFYGGLIFKLCGAYPSYSGTKDYEVSLRNHIKFLNDGHSLCIFPQGRRVRNGEVAKIRGGIGYLVERTDKPVVPVAIMDIPNRSFINTFIRRKTIHIRIGNPIYKKDLFDNVEATEDKTVYQVVAGKIMDNILNLKK
jgi:1-acyl-sn-glycerol-3-phosphate acyltransferase